MGLISSLFRKIFGNNSRQEPKQVLSPNENLIARWKKEREENVLAIEREIKDWLTGVLKNKGEVPFSWESGNDEALITFQNGVDFDDDNFEELEQYILGKLDIPDAGEFQMNGKGVIYIAQGEVRVKYSSIFKTTIDFDEETEEEIFSEEEHDSGDIILYKA